MTNDFIDLNKILRESQETLLNPKVYFSSTPTSGGYKEPLIKAVFYGLVAGLFSLLWAVTGLSPMGGLMWSGAAGITTLIYSMIGAVIAVFISGALMLVISMICGGINDYEANVRVAASLMVVYPINAFMAFLYGINTNLAGGIGLLISFYSIYLIYEAEILALKGKESTVKIVAIVLVGLSLLGFFGGRKATRTFEDISDKYENEFVE